MRGLEVQVLNIEWSTSERRGVETTELSLTEPLVSAVDRTLRTNLLDEVILMRRYIYWKLDA